MESTFIDGADVLGDHGSNHRINQVLLDKLLGLLGSGCFINVSNE